MNFSGILVLSRRIRDVGAYLYIVRYFYAASRYKNLLESSVFHTYIILEDKWDGVMIDGSRWVYMICKSIAEKMRPQPHVITGLIKFFIQLLSVVLCLFSF